MQIRSQMVALIALFGSLFSTPSFAAPVEYVKICPMYGASYYYSPGTDSCVNAITGQVKTLTEIGRLDRQTYVVARVRALESDYCDGCFAVVHTNGAITRSKLAAGSTHVSAGWFDVLFGKSVAGCALKATLVSADNSGTRQLPGSITVARTPNTDDKGVSVWTYNLAGNPVDRSFHLALVCKNKNPFCTVTDADGTHDCTGDEPVPGLGPPGP